MIFDTQKAVRTAFDFILDNKKSLSPFLRDLFKRVSAEKNPTSPDALGYTIFQGLGRAPEIFVSENGILGSLKEAGVVADEMRKKMDTMRDANWQSAISSLDGMEKMYIGILSHEIAHLFADNALFPLVQMISTDDTNPVNRARIKKIKEAQKEGKQDAKFTPEELCSIFENIVGDFHDSGMEEFDIEWKDSGAISVNSGTKKISIPKNRKSMTRNEVEGLIVHELGTHYMRGQTGNQYKIPTLKNGLDGYLETEEGIARAMEMAVKGEYAEAGIGHYITAGLAFFDSKNLREVFEINWRLKVLASNKGDLSRGDIENKRKEAYKATQRIFRGTDELPWFKDLSYFNGGQKIWQYIEENIGSEEMFDNFFLGGKNNLLDDSQQRQIYELKVGKR